MKSLVFSFLTTFALGAIPEHEVTSLPGWTGPLKSKHYSGYIPVGNLSGTPGYIHYWFIESEKDPVNDPVVYWTNGGPGGSGISTGLLTEMGQVALNDNSKNADGSLKVLYNPYSWSRVANTLYVSQPKGVGFSYCEDETKECVNNDLTAAQDAYDFFINWFNKYPEYKKNDFYLTAESYGGIYIPMFMDQIDKNGGVDNFKGAAIGDGCWGNEVGLCAFSTGKAQQIQVEFFHGHAMYDQPLYNSLQTNCGNFSNSDVKQPKCLADLAEMNLKIGSFNIYNVYDTCANDQTFRTLAEYNSALSTGTVFVKDENVHNAVPHPQLSSSPVLGGGLNDYSCGGQTFSAQWLNQPDVAKALHVKTGTKGMRYEKGPMNVSGDLRPLYKKLIQKYRMLIYSGDTDGCVPEWGTEEWVRELGFPVKKDWRPWKSQHENTTVQQRAGYAIDYDVNDFKLVTVQGAGHMIPTFKPHFALTMITKFLNNEEF
mmetsp:Transcript_13047/g.25294  ORF Transcript_13047/g.25294 Transcript_13047/m.25294 type:complete len:484 (+) Transcript_13047:51-1502(+)|eukprot:CAMPEP_0175141726 /NCGR_PEP_ID=MMETSP0087-20121206/12311_1 /TAXON_ID=136419 /ORGANISM="Unknown Unknown, Strain D1" /LENGTH=483 /DNA_ID=CAMNT_0016425265 /DNA_START=25 /DNA_END=1476 /DNA_ORIENTATION=+